MLYASVSNRAGETVGVEEHVRELLTVAGEAAAAGDSEIERILRSHARFAAARPEAAAGDIVIVRQDGSKFRLSNVRANIRRVNARGKAADLAKINDTLRQMNAIEAQDSKPRTGRPGGDAATDQIKVWGTLRAMELGVLGRKKQPAPKSDWEEEELERMVDGYNDSDFE